MNLTTIRSQLVGSLHPLQTAIKCSVLRKWPIESMCVCFSWQNGRRLLEWVEVPFLWRQNKQIHRDFCSFSANRGNPVDLECHDIVLKGIVWIFFPFTSLVENAYVSAGIFRKSLQTRIKLRENLHLLHIGFCS